MFFVICLCLIRSCYGITHYIWNVLSVQETSDVSSIYFSTCFYKRAHGVYDIFIQMVHRLSLCLYVYIVAGLSLVRLCVISLYS